MSPAAFTRCSTAIVMVGVLGLLAGPCMADAAFDTTGSGASARLNFVIKIPAVLRIIDNSHPIQLQSNAEGIATAAQRLELQSNLKQGFCVMLRQPDSGDLSWSMEASSDRASVARQIQGGYHICFSQPGRHVVTLRHRFSAPGSAAHATWSWPLMTEFMAI